MLHWMCDWAGRFRQWAGETVALIRAPSKGQKRHLNNAMIGNLSEASSPLTQWKGVHAVCWCHSLHKSPHGLSSSKQ
eukprot:4410613-Amphidinium_carterae.1